MNTINNFAFALFGKHIQERKDDYSEIRTAIRQAHISLPWDIYVGTAYLYAIISAILGAITAYYLMPLWHFIYTNNTKITLDSGFPEIRFSGLMDYKESAFILIIILLFSLVIGRIAYYGISAYPGMMASVRKNKIDLTLPHAVAYMHALSKGGLSLVPIFKSLSHQINIYGTAAEEIAFIVIDIELRGSDLITALKTAAVRTQSEKFRDFLENLVNVAATSGDIETFLENTVNQYHKTAETDQSLYLEMLRMLAETYITLFVAGPLFLITILIVVGLTGPGSLSIFKILIYIVIPFSSFIFSIMVDMISLHNDSRLIEIYSVSKKIKHYSDVRTFLKQGDDRLIRKLIRSLRWTNVLNMIKNPFKIFFTDPFKAFYIAVPAALIYFILSVYQKKITVDSIDNPIIISILILLAPFLFFYEMQSRRIYAIEGAVPGFLKRLAIINDMGMPLAEAIKTISKINFGILSSEIKLIHKDIVWSNSFHDALMKFESRIRTVSISRIVTLITKASESARNVKETLKAAANYAELNENLRRQKFTVLFSHLIVMYISFTVFLLVLYIFAKVFLPQIPSTSSNGINMFSISGHKEEYSILFMHATVIQGFFSGIIVGRMIGDSGYDGLKHSFIMMSIAYIFFTWFV